MGQFANYLRSNFEHLSFRQFNKLEGLPFTVKELKEKFVKILEE